MILDAEQAKGNLSLPPDEVGILERGPFAFYVTGSRYFGCERPDSDWDFIAEDSVAIRAYLDSYGFTKDKIASVLRRDSVTCAVRERGKTQIQLVTDARTKRLARDYIREHNAEYHRRADNALRTRLWNEWMRLITLAPIPARTPLGAIGGTYLPRYHISTGTY